MVTAKSLGLKKVTIDMGIFDFRVLCVIGEYEATAKYVAWKFEDKDFDAEASNRGYEPRGKCFMRRGYVPLIWLPTVPKTPRELATLAHEAVHAVLFMFDWAAVPSSDHTEEVLGHAVGHLVYGILSKLK